jgi:uncharacterized protein YacL
MLKLPICPYCHTVYGYREVLKNKNKISVCYHCKKKFKQSKIKGYSCLTILGLFVAVLINFFILNIVDDILVSIVPIFITSILVVILCFLLSPYFVTYRKQIEKKKQSEKSVKNKL